MAGRLCCRQQAAWSFEASLEKEEEKPIQLHDTGAVENDVQFSHELGQARASHTIQQDQYWVYWGVLGVLGLLGALGCTGCIGVYWAYWGVLGVLGVLGELAANTYWVD